MRTPDIASRERFMKAMHKVFPGKTVLSRPDIFHVCKKMKVEQPFWVTNNPNIRVGRGLYDVQAAFEGRSVVANSTSTTNKKLMKESKKARKQSFVVESVPVAQTTQVISESPVLALASPTTENVSVLNLVPEKTEGYVPFGHYKDITQIIKQGIFYPAYITGLTGNGKTLMAIEVCAALKREMIRANITEETDEDDLIGGMRLVNGNTVWQNGPVITAMERGAVLLLDEVDLGGNRLMCLQPVLEGKSIYVKKINRVVHPAPGFTVIATANTKGKGSDDGRYVGTRVQNEAFLERFPITFEQEYPKVNSERKIVKNVFALNSLQEDEFSEYLVAWADITRTTFNEGGCSELISTRRLVHIAKAYVIFKDRMKAIQLCLNRFDDDTKQNFIDLYRAIDVSVGEPAKENQDPAVTSDANSEDAEYEV